MLDLDVSRPLRSQLQLRRLIDAVLAAEPTDEAMWVEWKTNIDLGTNGGRGTVARHVLGFANRPPELAARQVGGCGYLLVGVEPGRLAGVTPVDLADLEPQVQRYLGVAGPVWSAQFIGYDQGHVLVVIVDPPQPGDPIHRLELEFSVHNEHKAKPTTYRSGTVFVRRKAKTEIANAAELDALQARLLQRTDRLLVTLELGDQATPVPRLELGEPALEAWLERERAVRLAARGPLGRREVPEDIMAELGRTILLGLQDTRTEEDYRAQVNAYLARLHPQLVARAYASAFRQRLGGLDLMLANSTDRNFAAVEIIVTIQGVVLALDEEPEHRLPTPPRPWKTPPPLMDLGDPWASPLVVPAFVPPNLKMPEVSIEKVDHGVELRFAAVDLRPQERALLPVVQLLARAEVDAAEVVAAWSATSTASDGLQSGTLAIPVEARVRPLDELLKWIDDDDGAQDAKDEQERG